MNRHLKQALRRRINYKKELLAIFVGLAFAYAWQVFGYLMGCLSGHETMPAEYLIPNLGIMLAVAPIVAWACLGLFRVNWIKHWARISLCGLAVAIPFAIISVVVIFIGKASLWSNPMFWVGNVAISIVLALTLFRPFVKVEL